MKKITSIIIFVLQFNMLSAQDTLTNEQVLTIAFFNNSILKNLALNVEMIQGEYYNVNNFFPSYPKIDIEYESGNFITGSGSYNLDVSLSQEVEIGGQVSHRKEIANLKYKKAKLIYETKLFEFENDLKNVLTEINARTFRLELLKDRLELTKEILDFSRQRLNVGDISELDYNLIQIDFGRSQIEFNKAEQEYKKSILSLSEYIGEESFNISYVIPDTTTVSISTDFEHLKYEGFANRNELKLLDFDIKENESEISLIRSEFIPNLELKMGYGHGRSVISGDEIIGTHNIQKIDDKERNIILGLKFSLPLAISGLFSTRDGDIQISNVKKNIALNSKMIKETEIKTEISNAFGNYQTALSELRLMQNQLPVIESSIGLLTRGYRAGELSVINFLNELSKLYDYRGEYFNTLERFKLSEIELERAIQSKLK